MIHERVASPAMVDVHGSTFVSVVVDVVVVHRIVWQVHCYRFASSWLAAGSGWLVTGYTGQGHDRARGMFCGPSSSNEILLFADSPVIMIDMPFTLSHANTRFGHSAPPPPPRTTLMRFRYLNIY